jgi:hypothetical protein
MFGPCRIKVALLLYEICYISTITLYRKGKNAAKLRQKRKRIYMAKCYAQSAIAQRLKLANVVVSTTGNYVIPLPINESPKTP